MNAAKITRLAYKDGLKTRDTMDLLLDDEHLLRMNRLKCSMNLSKREGIDLNNGWPGWRAFKPAILQARPTHSSQATRWDNSLLVTVRLSARHG